MPDEFNRVTMRLKNRISIPRTSHRNSQALAAKIVPQPCILDEHVSASIVGRCNDQFSRFIARSDVAVQYLPTRKVVFTKFPHETTVSGKRSSACDTASDIINACVGYDFFCE